MKARFAAGIACLAAAIGLGTGVAAAAEAPSAELTTPDLAISVPAIEIEAPTEVPAGPSSSDVLKFLADSITMAGRDVLTATGIQNVLRPEVATPAVFDTLADETAETDGKSELNRIGDDFDGFWKSIENALASVSEPLASPIKGLRNSEAWKNDYFRIMFTVGLFALPVAPILGAIAGVGVAALVALGVAAVPALPILGAGLVGGLAAGFFAFGAAFLSGGVGLIFALLFGLVFFGGGIALIALSIATIIPSAGGGAIAAIVIGVILIILSPLFLLAIGSAIGVIIAGIVGFILLTGAGVAVMVIPAVIVGGIAGAVAGAIALVLAVPALGLVGAALPVVLIIVGLILWAALGSTRPANEKKPGEMKASNDKAKKLPANPDKDKMKKKDAPKLPGLDRVPAPQPAPQPADKDKDKAANDKKADSKKADKAATRADFALAA